ncbi:MAG TPA: hypothetical protein PLJ60_14040 [Chryseolinea sp.]|nr:hypothetical protein [Chryseolinea sp.]
MLKKWIIGVASFSILSFLILRLVLNHVNGVKEERQWYIDQLHFEFSATIDSVRSRHILFHLNRTDIDWNTEQKLNEVLQFNGRLDLFLYRPNYKIELMIPDANRYMKGDSLYFNSDKNVIALYRDHHILAEYSVVSSLKGRPF